jgi:acetyl-CoA decarbonylase/synthase complex subunit gamma
MKVASGQAGLDDCPHLDADARSKLDEASSPPQRLVKISGEIGSMEIGQETVLFRHDEKFHRAPAVALKLSDAEVEVWSHASAAFKELEFSRVGETLRPDMIALFNDSQSTAMLRAAAETIDRELGVPLVLIAQAIDSLGAVATGPLKETRPLLFCTGDVSLKDLAALARQTGCPLGLAGDLPSLAQRVEQLGKEGVKDIVISPGTAPPQQTLEFLTQTRRAALKYKFRPLGCPVLVRADSDDPIMNAMDACAYICKYAGIVVVDLWDGYLLAPVLTTRQNIYTDPQKPVQVEPKIHEIGETTPVSPLLVTTNFSLSYYSVESQVEASRVPCYILAVDTEGTSVLTAWASDKFNAETITAALKQHEVDGKIKHRKLVIPGLVASIAASVSDESGWDVVIGPKEATGIGPFLKAEWSAA